MYRLLGDKMVDTKELIEELQGNGVRVIQDISNATKRDDAIGLRILAPLQELGVEDTIEDELQMDELMQAMEKRYTEKLEKMVDSNFSVLLYAYGYDEVENGILLNMAIMNRFIARRKLPDILKRLFDV